MQRIVYALKLCEDSTMHLFGEHHLREALSQAAAQQGTDEESHLVRRLLLHPRAVRAFHEMVENAIEQQLPTDAVAAMSSAAAVGSIVDVLTYILNNWQTVVADIMTLLKAFKIIP